MGTWYKPVTRELTEFKGYSPRFTVKEPEQPKPKTVSSPINESTREIKVEESKEVPTSTQYTKAKEQSSKSFKSKNDFKSTMLPIYENLLSKMGISISYAKALVAQDGLESAWGTKPSGKFNFGGIKGKGTTKRTREVINGRDVYMNDSFRDFNSLEDYAKYKIELLNNKRYNAFLGDLGGFADRVHKGGYATDPKYTQVLNKVIASAKQGGILKFQAGGSGEIRPDNRSWFRKKWDHVATDYATSQFADSAVGSLLADTTPFGLFHYSVLEDPDTARLAALPAAVPVSKAVKAAEKGVELVYKHYGNNIAKYFQGTLKHLKNAFRGAPSMEERLAVPKQISKVRANEALKHDYAFFKDPKTGETILEINPAAKFPKRAGEKAASKQMLQELVGTQDDYGLRGLSSTEKELFPKKFLSNMTGQTSAKDVYSRIMSYKAEAGITSSFEALSEKEVRQIFDMAWDANMFYPTTNANALQGKEVFWKENRQDIVKLFRRVPAILGAGIVGNEVLSERNGGVIKAQQGSDTKQWMKDWLAKRAPQLKGNARESVLTTIASAIVNPSDRQAYSMDTYTLAKGNLDERTNGKIDHKNKTITVNGKNTATEVHEWTHAANPIEQVTKIRELLKTWGTKPGVIPERYLENPNEIYSRLMAFRYKNNIDPNREFTLEELQKLRKDLHSGDYLLETTTGNKVSNINNPAILPEGTSINKVIDLEQYHGEDNLFNRYDDSLMLRLLNDVAMKKNRKPIQYAKFGTEIKNPWDVLPEQMQQKPIDPNWKSPEIIEPQLDFSGIITSSNRGYNTIYINYINNFLNKKGYTLKQRAPILGDIIEESGGDPFAKSNTGKYSGILQWSPERYSITETDPYKELDKQLEYLHSTIYNTTDRVSWTYGGNGSPYTTGIQANKTFLNPEIPLDSIHSAFSYGYVRPKGKRNSYINRQKVVDQVFNIIK